MTAPDLHSRCMTAPPGDPAGDRAGRRSRVRAQASPIGVVLVFGFAIVGSVLIVALGASVLGDAQQSLGNDRAEKVLTQFDSKAALVALGNTDTQRVTIPRSSDGDYTLDDGAGWMNVSYVNASGNTSVVFNETMGSFVYQSGQETIAYQGGGVWRSSAGGRAVMVSPPEFHYRDRTLTLPMIRIQGDGGVTGSAVITHDETTQRFPDQSREEFVNPVNGTAINVTIHSEYYTGWGGYFTERTEGSVTYDHDAQEVTLTLVPPFEESYENAVATTYPNGVESRGGGDDGPSPVEEGVNYPSLDDRIENRIDECENDSTACDRLNSSNTPITSQGTYWSDGDYGDSFTIDDPGGNVSIVIDGDYTPQTVSIKNISDPYTVTAYVRGDFESETYNERDGNASESTVILHSDGDFTVDGSSTFVGLLYAPQSSCTLNGSPTIDGALVCETYTDNGQPATSFNYDSDVNDIRLSLQSEDVTQLQYLHVTTNVVTVDDG